jgi:hypothetical protein
MSSSAQQPPSGKSDMTKSESLLILTGGRYYSPKISNLCYQLLVQLAPPGQQELLDLLGLLDSPDHLDSRLSQERLGLLAPLVLQVLQAQQVQAVLLGQLEQLVLRVLKEFKETLATPAPPVVKATSEQQGLLGQLARQVRKDYKA